MSILSQKRWKICDLDGDKFQNRRFLLEDCVGLVAKKLQQN
jgi:hypothetical protein